MFPPRTKPYGTANAESERFSTGCLPFEPRKHLLRARNARFVPFSPSAKAALDGAKGVHGAVEGASGALGAIHGWQRAPESLAACGEVGPTAQGAVGEPESGGRQDRGACGGRYIMLLAKQPLSAVRVSRTKKPKKSFHFAAPQQPPRMVTTQIPSIPSVANAGVCFGCSRKRRDRRTPCTKHRWSRSGSLE